MRRKAAEPNAGQTWELREKFELLARGGPLGAGLLVFDSTATDERERKDATAPAGLVSVSRQLGQLGPVHTNLRKIASVHPKIKLRAQIFCEEKQRFREKLFWLLEPRRVVRLQQCREQGLKILGGAIQFAPHPEAEGHVYFIPIVPRFVHSVGFRSEIIGGGLECDVAELGLGRPQLHGKASLRDTK